MFLCQFVLLDGYLKVQFRILCLQCAHNDNFKIWFKSIHHPKQGFKSVVYVNSPSKIVRLKAGLCQRGACLAVCSEIELLLLEQADGLSSLTLVVSGILIDWFCLRYGVI